MRGFALLGCAAFIVLPLPASGQATSTTQAAAPASADPAVAKPILEPDAVAALKTMSDFLMKLNTFDLVSNATLELVTVNEQKLQIDGTVHYKVAKPGIWIDFDTDLKHRQYFYDGKQFTIFAPKLGFYASMPAPATNREFLKAVHEKTGIELPLEDLFRWNDGDDTDLKELTWGFNVGRAKIDGVETEHWAFRQGDIDWEVWIQRGGQPLPLKMAIVDRTDPERPGYTARLKWTVNPALTANDFTYVPGPDAKKIQIATLVEEAK
jgi:hypothetical protein